MMPQQTEKLTDHFAIFTGGNEQWGDTPCPSCEACHLAGAESLSRIINACFEFGIQYLTIYAFSTENWGRPADELRGLKQIFNDAFSNELEELIKNGVRILHIGQRDEISPDLLQKIDRAVETSKTNDKLILTVALNYGSRNEIMHAVRKIVASGIPPEEVTEQVISDSLFTAGTPDPDLVIRTSGEQRLSNFLLWQSAYSEWVFPEAYWPDYNREESIKSLEEYAKRDRRFGKLSSK